MAHNFQTGKNKIKLRTEYEVVRKKFYSTIRNIDSAFNKIFLSYISLFHMVWYVQGRVSPCTATSMCSIVRPL
jgi:hypothetical protein